MQRAGRDRIGHGVNEHGWGDCCLVYEYPAGLSLWDIFANFAQRWRWMMTALTASFVTPRDLQAACDCIWHKNANALM